PLEPLNVMIGPNAAGKSNLIETISLLQAAPNNLAAPTRRDGVANWLWKGTRTAPVAEIEAIVGKPGRPLAFRWRLAFTVVGGRFELVDEVIENELPSNPRERDPFFFYKYQQGHPVVNMVALEGETEVPGGRRRRQLRRESLKPDQSVLAQLKDPDVY